MPPKDVARHETPFDQLRRMDLESQYCVWLRTSASEIRANAALDGDVLVNTKQPKALCAELADIHFGTDTKKALFAEFADIHFGADPAVVAGFSRSQPKAVLAGAVESCAAS